MEFKPVFSSKGKAEGSAALGVARDAGQLAGNTLGGKNIVDTAGGDGTVGHANVFRAGFVLSEGDAALSLNFGQAESAVGTGSRQDHADAAMALVFGKRAHELIDGHMYTADLSARSKMQGVIDDGHRSVRRDHKSAIGFDLHPIGDFSNSHGGFFGEQVGESALVPRVKMLDGDEGHAGVGGEIANQF